MFKQGYFLVLLIIHSHSAISNTNYLPESIPIQSLIGFQSNPPEVKKIIELGLQLASLNLGYKYGSADPHLGGMDCSGTIYYLLNKRGIKTPARSSNDLYNWVKKEGVFYSTSTSDIQSKDFSRLKPGDLLFWSGTYNAPQNAYVTHVMMYVGKNDQGKPLMVGSSDGRTYKGRQIYGVSVFDFILPSSGNSKFLGYSCIPQLSCPKQQF